VAWAHRGKIWHEIPPVRLSQTRYYKFAFLGNAVTKADTAGIKFPLKLRNPTT